VTAAGSPQRTEPDLEAPEKLKELFAVARDALAEAQNRFMRIDQKASWLLSALTAAIAALPIPIGTIVNLAIPPRDLLSGFALVCVSALTVTMVFTWIQLLSVLRLWPIARLPMTEEMLEFYLENRHIDIHHALIRACAEAWTRNTEVANRKARRLTIALGGLAFTVGLVALTAAMVIILSWRLGK